MKIQVAGAAGLIGSALSLILVERDDIVIGTDNHNDYYDPTIKEVLLAHHTIHTNYSYLRIDLVDRKSMGSALPPTSRCMWSNSLPKPSCASPPRACPHISTATSSALLTSWKNAATIALKTWCKPAVLVCKGPIRLSPSRRITVLASPLPIRLKQ